VSPVGLGLVALGLVMFSVGVRRMSVPWRRYRALQEQDANAARYRAWRGGPPSAAEETGASVAMAMLRRRAQREGLIAVAGGVLVFLGFLVG
jgi:hypothetical protein